MDIRRFFLAAAVASLLGTSSSAAASVMIETPVPELAQRADVVARGRVAATETRLSGDGMRIFTVVTLQVEEAWKGAPGDRVQLQVPGGTHDGIAQVVQGAPRFTEGEEVVVFLQGVPPQVPLAEMPPLRVVAMAQGKFSVEKDAAGAEFAVPDLSGVEFLRPGSGEVVHAPLSAPVPLRQLEQQVKAAR